MAINYTPVPEHRKPGKVEDLVGRRFGRLIAVRYVGRARGGGAAWECRCDCGALTVSHAGRLKQGKVVSCGCRSREVLKEYPGSRGRKHWKNNAPPSAITLLYRRYKAGSKYRGIAFELTEREFEAMVTLPCHYCGEAPSRLVPGSPGHTESMALNGLDRRDNDVGYVTGNCASCCGMCNMAKRDMKEGDFLGWVKRIAEHQSWIRHVPHSILAETAGGATDNRIEVRMPVTRRDYTPYPRTLATSSRAPGRAS